jgi:hypothetical protein
MGGRARHTPAIEPARKAADYRYAWWLKFDKICRKEEAPKVGALGDIESV